MGRWMSIGGVAAATTFLSSTALFAQVTAEGVWQDWTDYMSSVGYEVEAGSTGMSGDTLTISDLNAVSEIGDGEGTISMALDEVTLRERGDGTVEVSMSDVYTVSVEGGEEDLDLELTFEQTGMTIVASGDDAETAYNIVTAGLTMTSSRFEVDGKPVNGSIDMALSNYTGSYVLTDGEPREVSGSGRMDDMDFAVKIDEPEEDVVVDATMKVTDLVADFAMSLPEMIDPENMAATLAEGFSVSGTYTVGSTEYAMAGKAEKGETFELAGSSGQAEVSFVMDEGGIGLDERVADFDIALSGSEIPLPQVTLSASEYGLTFRMPVAKSNMPEDFALGLRLVDLAVQEEIWAMFDPMGALPHDPATVIIETDGQANWYYDIMDPEAQETMEEAETPPGELHALNLKDLRVSVAGAELTGSGGFTFDNSDLATFNGAPRPEGSVDLKLVGGNTLLDTLVQMGLLPEDQAMGARMMLGLFAVPGEGEDTLNSKIEINDQGQILANGQRLQ